MGRAAGWGRPGQPALQQSSRGANTSRWKKWESNDLGLHGGPSCFRPSSGARPWARVGGGRWEQTERSEIHPTKHPERQLVELGSRVYLRVGLGDTCRCLGPCLPKGKKGSGTALPPGDGDRNGRKNNRKCWRQGIAPNFDSVPWKAPPQLLRPHPRSPKGPPLQIPGPDVRGSPRVLQTPNEA